MKNEVYGHKRAKKVLNVLMNRAQERYYKKCIMGRTDYQDRLNCLLVGQSGTGKTHLVRTLCKQRNIPLLTISATDLMPTGNDTGTNKKQLQKLIRDTAAEYTKKPEYHSVEGVLNQMIIFVDEFDKLGVSYDSTGNWNKHVQASFLTLIEDGGEFAGLSWIFAGAFSSLYTGRTNKPRPIGFFAESAEPELEEITDKDIIGAGIIPEMVGRIPLIVQLDDFTVEDYANIARQIMATKYNMLNLCPVQIAETAHASGQGVRSITRQLEMALIEFEDDAPWVMPSAF